MLSDLCNKLINIINISSETVWLFRQQYFFNGYGKLKLLISMLSESLQKIMDVTEVEYIENMGVAQLLDAQKNEDEILIADIIEGQLEPCIEHLVQELERDIPIESIDFYSSNIKAMKGRGWNELVDKIENAYGKRGCQYISEYTASGEVTIRIVEYGMDYYISGNNNPYRDALYFTKGNIEPDKYKYTVIGAGMFYEPQALLNQRPDAEITVIEEDAFLLKLALTYRDLREVLSDARLTVVCCAYGEIIKASDLNEQSLWFRKPAVKHIENEEHRMALERFFVKSMTVKEQAYVLEKQFRQNTAEDRIVKSVDECRNRFAGKTVYLVAGGPSLNSSLDILRNRDDDSIILCVGTSVGVLKNAEIIPDFIIVIDVSENICAQLMENVDYENSTLLYMISANSSAVSLFKGDKYAIFQKGFDMAEEYAENHGYSLVSTGGSVSTTALDICINFKCKRVVCLGLDLAHTGNKSHAEGTLMNAKTYSNIYTTMVKGISGEMISTSLALSCYHHWIEERIAHEDDIEFINVSDGAYINGMKNVQVKDMRDMIPFR